MRLYYVCVVAFGLVACGSEIVVHGVNEKEANQIIEILADSDIASTKIVNVSGREQVYDISVGTSQRVDAVRTLNLHELPRRRDRGYQETFSESGLIPTSGEERAKRMGALEGEIERQLKLIDGVLDVQVQIVMPEESALRTTGAQEPPTTASVTIKYLGGAKGERPIAESEIQAIVAAGVEKLSPENVVVRMAQAGKMAVAAVGAGQGSDIPRKYVVGGAVVGLVVLALLGLGLVFSQLSLRRVRGRLVRLQNEIAKAKGGKRNEALPAQGSNPGSVSGMTTP